MTKKDGYNFCSRLCVSVALDDLLVGGDSLGDLGILPDLVPDLGDGQLLLVEGLGLNLALDLQGGDDVLVLPADLVGKATNSAVL